MSLGWRSWGGAAVALMMGGCGGAGTAGDRCASGVRTSDLRTQLRREQHAVRNLENEVSLLRAQLRERPAGSRGSVPAPSPPAGAPAQEAEAPRQPQAGRSIYGGEVEIVYEGDAARPTGTRPRIELHESTRVSEGLAVESEGDDTPAPAPAPLPDLGGERLPVVPGKIPTVDEQLRRARAATSGGATVRPSLPVTRPAAVAARAPVPARQDRAPVPAPKAATPAVTQPAVTQPAPPAEPAGDAMAEYRRYVNALKRGNHDFAVSGMRSFLARYPDHYLADNVQFFMAQSYYERRMFAVAMGEYQKVVERHWRGNKLPDAMLKVGLCQLALGKPEAARAALRRLVARFPRTKPGKVARARLKELKRQ